MSVLSAGLGKKNPVTTDELAPSPDAPEDTRSVPLSPDLLKTSNAVGPQAIGSLIRKAVDFVPNLFDPDNENRNFALAGLNFLGPSNYLTGESAWKSGVGSLQHMMNEQALASRETQKQQNTLDIATNRQTALDERAGKDRDSREGIAEENRVAAGERNDDRLTNAETVAQLKATASAQIAQTAASAVVDAATLTREQNLNDAQHAEALALLKMGGVPAKSGPDLYDRAFANLQSFQNQTLLEKSIKDMLGREMDRLEDAQHKGAEYMPSVWVADYMFTYADAKAKVAAKSAQDREDSNE
jgi:hypothetical protein